MSEETEEPEGGGDFNPCKGMLAFLTALGVNIAMVVVGVLYSDSCTIRIIPQFLQIGGGVMLGLSGLYLVCCVCCCGKDDGDVNFGCAIVIV